MKTLRRVATEMALHVLAYNLTRVMSIFGIQPLLAGNEGIATARCRSFSEHRTSNSHRPQTVNAQNTSHNQDPL